MTASIPLRQRMAPLAMLAGLLAALGPASSLCGADSPTAAVGPPTREVVEAPEGLDPFYAKGIDVDGYWVLSSEKVSDYALKEAAYLIDLMLAKRPDILRALAETNSRMTVMAHDEFTTDVPEHRHLGKERLRNGKDWWDRRARGLGGSKRDPVASCGEENLLCFPGDPYAKENILIHEFAHTIHLRGLNHLDPDFDDRVRELYESAIGKGLWKDAYASRNHAEYFAEGVQCWFDNNRENDKEHNHVNTRRELREYDPDFAALLEEVFGDTELVYVRPPDRKQQRHLEGYDYRQAPTFRWPERLQKVEIKVERPSEKQIAEMRRPRLFLENRRDETLIVEWLPEKGSPQAAGTIAAGEDFTLLTTQAHVIRVRNHEGSFQRKITVTKDRETILLAAAATATAGAKPATSRRKPNILFIAVDDLNDWIGVMGGHPQARTPNFDRLAASSVLFTNAHCPGAACNPSRTAIMTGLSPATSGLYENGQKMREVLPDAELLPKYFARHGYHAHGSGKLLHYFIDARSWDDYYPEASSENPFPPTLYPDKRPVSLPRGGPWQYVETDWGPLDATDEAFGGDWLVSKWVGERLGETREKPFFLACGLYRPHEPWFVPKKYFELFPLDEIQLPPGYKEDDLDDLPPEGKRRGPNRYFAHIREHNQWKQGIQGYLASIAFADAMLGRVLDALEAGPNKDNTIVVLWSDHGWHLGEKQHWQKFTPWRAVTRVPLMIQVPEGVASGLLSGTQAGSVCDRPVNLLDLFPTLTELTGLPRKEDNDGRSLVPLLRDPRADWNHVSITHLGQPGGYGLSADNWRYIRHPGGDEELYHIAEDPWEWHNLAPDSKHRAKLEELRSLGPTSFTPKPEPSDTSLPSLQWIRLSGDPAPSSKPDGNPFDVVFINRDKRAVELHWVDGRGRLKPFGVIEPGKRKPQQTRPGAVWAILDADAKPRGYFRVGDRKAKAVVPELTSTAKGPRHSATNRQPNVLFIAVDDLRPELGCYGIDEVHSPHIDRLAASGVRFDHAYCQLAVCNPSRVSLLTGLRPDTTKVWDLATRFRHTIPDAVTLPQHFKQAGYTTLSYGKIFHNPWPDNVSWSEPHSWPKGSSLWSKEARAALTDFQEGMRRAGKPQRSIDRLRAAATEIVDLDDREHIDGAIADQALEAMRRLAKNEDRPFFLAAGFIRPHLPFVVPRKYWDLYDRATIPLAADPDLPQGAPRFAMNTMYELRDYMDYLDTEDPREGSLTEAQQRELKHGYYAAVSFIDAQVGRLLDELDRLDLADNTVVVLWGDHGWKLGEHNSWCKQTNYEIDTRSPLIIRAPGAKGNGRASPSLVEFIDLYPTLCELAGLSPPETLEGLSLCPLLETPEETLKEAAFSQFPRRDGKTELMGYAMRTERHRYIEWLERSSGSLVARELYDHQNDPKEKHNLAASAKGNTRGLLDQLSQQLWATLPKPEKAERPRLTFRNAGVVPLTVSWLPPEGAPRHSGKVTPGKSHTVQTTKGHRFLVENKGIGFRQVVTVEKDRQTLEFSPQRGTPQAASSHSKGAPNLVVIVGDDWSWPHAGILGDPVAKTPTFDRIAREGVLFENAFVSAPSCTPSRFAIATGQDHWRLGEGAHLGGSLAADVPVYADRLANAGYHIGFSRKGAAPSEHTYRQSDPFGPRFESFESFLDARRGDQPFCYWYGAGEPHRPYDWQSSRDRDLDFARLIVPPYLPDTTPIRTDFGDYYLRVQKLDRLAGSILEQLAAAGELENTLVVMTSDNGMPFPRAKATLYDSGIRVPLAVRWGAKVPGGRKISDFVSLTDLAPTFLQAAGLSVPESMTGRSLLETLESQRSGRVDPDRDQVVAGMERHVYPHPSRALRTEDFLYIRNFSPHDWPSGEGEGEGAEGKPRLHDFSRDPWPTTPGSFSFNIDPSPTKQAMLQMRASGALDGNENIQLAFAPRPLEELYDLKRDPHQLTNVAEHAEYAEERARLARQLDEALRASGDPRYRHPEHVTFELRGWTLHLNDRLWQERPAVVKRGLEIIALQLDRVLEKVPEPALSQLRKIPFWLNPPYEGKRGSAEYHPDRDWLERNGRNPAMAKAMEFTNLSQLPFENRRMPYVVLHELAHGYHDRVLGFDEPEILAAFEKARDSGGYDKIRRWNGRSYSEEKAYAMSNHKEYFAETTEAYFGRNDFFPFNREELRQHDPEMLRVIEKVWGIEPPSAQQPATAPARQQLPVDYNHPPRRYATRELGGFELMIEQELLDRHPALATKAIAKLDRGIARALEQLPEHTHERLQKVRLFLLFGPEARKGGRPEGAEYFRQDASQHYPWLDPRMDSSIVFYHAANIAQLSEFWILKTVVHELSHAWHLEQWPELEAAIHAAWKAALDSGRYQTVRAEDAGTHNPNYAAQNHLEYFAELSTTYFHGNTYFPRDRASLREYDPEGYALIERYWGVPARRDAALQRSAQPASSP